MRRGRCRRGLAPRRRSTAPLSTPSPVERAPPRSAWRPPPGRDRAARRRGPSPRRAVAPPRRWLALRRPRAPPLAQRRDDRERPTSERALLQLLAPATNSVSSISSTRAHPDSASACASPSFPASARRALSEERRAPRLEPHLRQTGLHRREHRIARRRPFGPEAVGLVDEHLDRETRGAGVVEDLALALLHRLAGVEEPDGRVGFVERPARGRACAESRAR